MIYIMGLFIVSFLFVAIIILYEKYIIISFDKLFSFCHSKLSILIYLHYIENFSYNDLYILFNIFYHSQDII